MAGVTVVTQSLVELTVTSSINSFGTERRFEKSLTIAALKNKLEILTGGSAGSMQLELYDRNNQLVGRLSDDEQLLGFYPVEDRMRLHVIDNTMAKGEFEDVSQVEKFELTDEQYAQKQDSVRAFKQKMKMGQFKEIDPEEIKRKEEEKKSKLAEEEEAANKIKINDRCEVKVQGQPTKRGTVKYVGLTDFKPGYWVGVQYDEPLGKNDGSVQGKHYFTCQPKYGGFVKPNQVTVGDFPEDDLCLSDDDEM
ncbi:tubulin-folding cofactor B-like [Tubulanus polymorphus]|uniref:tubulin-folding cofactor B-like n=1 Tax=Tubulanus polymorphus TaxID=672921 RepID=UPI003DA5B5BF